MSDESNSTITNQKVINITLVLMHRIFYPIELTNALIDTHHAHNTDYFLRSKLNQDKMIAFASGVVALQSTIDIVSTLFTNLKPLLVTPHEIESAECIRFLFDVTLEYCAAWESSSSWKNGSIRKRLLNLKRAFLEIITPHWQDSFAFTQRIMTVFVEKNISAAYSLQMIQLPQHLTATPEIIEHHRQVRIRFACKFSDLFQLLLNHANYGVVAKKIRLTKAELEKRFRNLATVTDLFPENILTAEQVHELDGEKDTDEKDDVLRGNEGLI
jgi:hypothetical protein